MRFLSIFSLCYLYTILIFPQPRTHYYNTQSIDTNNIKMTFNNIGQLNYDTGAGIWSLLLDIKCIVFDQGLWVTGKINNEPKLSIVEWRSTYSPGPIIDGQAAMLIQPEDSLRYRIYKISRGDDSLSNPDYAEWPEDFGAPVNEDGTPKIFADQTLFSVYNGIDSTQEIRTWFIDNKIPPMPVEVQQLVYAHSGNFSDYEDIFSNTVFLEYTIINDGDSQIDSAFIGFWTDIDFDFYSHNFPAVDTTINLGYCWSDQNNNNGVTPAVGYKLIYGPVIESPADTAIFRGRIVTGFKNLELYSFHGIRGDTPNPLEREAWSVQDAWNFARGLDGDGNIIIDPVTGLPTRFPFNGDPVNNTGWLFEGTTGGEAGFVFFSGPFDLAPADTQWVMIALIPALGRNNLESIQLLREKAELLNSLPYDSLAFGTGNYFITDLQNEQVNIPAEYFLDQNYPNPFNPVTKISYEIPTAGKVTLTVFDVLGRKVANLVNEEKSPGRYSVEFNAAGLASGVYFYRLESLAYSKTKKMILLR